jgi:nicotinate-nucleotide adenylyltransferase
MRIGIYGGSFDPIHYGHLLLAEACREQCPLDEVWFLPTAVAPHKQKREPTPAAQRVAMLRAAVDGHAPFRVCTYEVDRGGVNYTVDTLEHFIHEDATRQLFLLVGADMLHDLPNWRRAADVCRLALPVAVDRPGSEPVRFDALRPLVTAQRHAEICRQRVDMPAIGLSSSLLRSRVCQGQSIRFMTAPAVAQFIDANRLYRE